MRKKLTPFPALALLFFLSAAAGSATVFAGDGEYAWMTGAQPSDAAATNGAGVDDRFRYGWREMSLGVAPLFSPITPAHNRPDLYYVVGYANTGFMLNDVWEEGFFRGNFEFLPETFGAGIYQDTGTYIVGATLLLRYNFVPAGWRLTPYIQGGGGITFLDIDHKYDGQNFNFNLDAALGIRYFLSRHVSVNAEYRFQHISNANTAAKNIGINADGPGFGVTWTF